MDNNITDTVDDLVSVGSEVTHAIEVGTRVRVKGSKERYTVLEHRGEATTVIEDAEVPQLITIPVYLLDNNEEYPESSLVVLPRFEDLGWDDIAEALAYQIKVLANMVEQFDINAIQLDIKAHGSTMSSDGIEVLFSLGGQYGSQSVKGHDMHEITQEFLRRVSWEKENDKPMLVHRVE
jgi:hypothetical protein|tara:strand:- start:590 stop:1126 length:537 start_codon:yes stop_codon:yes gene_type:complete